ncbi:MAG: hypothetical protein PUF17_10505 [Lactimicrobium massiliense]|nr:hypothetical protein [Lactimicrobium massiliense]MDD6561376.1 hypothetical protein [Lactimicrobium massiliense]
MESKVYVLKLGNYLYAGNKLVNEYEEPFLTDNLFNAKFHQDIGEVMKWQKEYGGDILQIDIKSHPVG